MQKGVSHKNMACVFFCLERKWGVQIAEMIFQTGASTSQRLYKAASQILPIQDKHL